MNVLISGACGYIGSILVPTLLNASHKVLALDSLERGGQGLAACCHDPNFEFVRGDCRDVPTMLKAMAKADAIIPLAGIVGVGACNRRPKAAQEVNADAIRQLMHHRSKEQLVVFPMTNSGYGTKTHEAICTEDSPLEPISLYGRTKAEAEQVVLAGENTVSLRLATVFGMSPAMRWDLIVNDFTRRAVLDRHLTVFEGHFRRNFVHVRDVADCFGWMLDRYFGLLEVTNVGSKFKEYIAGVKLQHNVFNLGNDAANMTKEKLACKVAEIVGNVYVHAAEVGIDPDKRDYVVSNQRLREAGFEAKRGLEEGIREVMKGVTLL